MPTFRDTNMPNKKAQSKAPRKKKKQQETSSTGDGTIISPEYQLKSLFDSTLARANEITKKYKESGENRLPNH
jgi:hypothetical protein